MFELASVTSALLGLLQGLTEFLPVSSSGHLVLAHALFGSSGADDLAFDALLHFATAAAIVVYFRHDFVALVRAMLQLPQRLHGNMPLETQHVTALALIVGTIPAVVLGLALEELLATAFRNPLLVAAALVVGSMLMVYAERVHARQQTVHSGVRSWRDGLVVGLFQSLALIPGMSRSGMAISGAMCLGLTRQGAARFAFLLGAPLLLGAGAKKALDVYMSGAFSESTISIATGVVVAFVSALVVIHVLLRFLRRHSLYWFVGYRLALALGVVLVVLL